MVIRYTDKIFIAFFFIINKYNYYRKIGINNLESFILKWETKNIIHIHLGEYISLQEEKRK